jgi:glycosyltransferase involved in cell wall biosynthesis
LEASPQDKRPDADVWVVITAYREASRLAGVLDGVCRRYGNVVVVDDGSPDETSRVALRYPIWVLRHPLNCGQGAALQTGIDFALRQGAAILVTFDGDGQHDADEIPLLLDPIRRGQADVVLGSRFLGRALGLPRERWLVLKLGVLFTRLTAGLRVTDTHNGLRALSRHAAQKICLTQDRMAHASEILTQVHQHRLRFVEVPVTIRYSPDTLDKGQSSWNALKIVGQLVLNRLIK